MGDASAMAGDDAIALLSGGLDSGVALATWCESARCRLALFVAYGQRAAEREAYTSRRIADRLGVRWQRVELPWLGDCARAAGAALVDRGAPLPERDITAPGDADTAAAVWVPARNLVLIAVAAAHAEALGCGVVVAGFNREEAATFADNSRDFVDAVDRTLRFAVRRPVRVESPTLGLDKPGIVAQARRLGWSEADFWSCYAGGARPCDRCESCARSARAWRHGSTAGSRPDRASP